MLSCSRETVPTITLNTEKLHFFHDAGSIGITLTSDKPWRATSSVDWCRVIPESGSATAQPVKIRVYCESNITPSMRHGVLSFEFEGCTTLLNVFQDGDELAVMNTEHEISSDGQIVEIPIWHNMEISVEIEKGGENWLRKLETKSQEQTTLVFEAKENTSAARSCSIFITAGSSRREIIIKQKASDIEFGDPTIKSYLLIYYDSNSDRCLSKDEAKKVRYLDTPKYPEVKSWKGFEYLTELERLKIYLGDPDGTMPDFRLFHKLKYLDIYISSNGYESLDLSTTGKLEEVHFGELKNTTLDLSNNKQLRKVSFSDFYCRTENINLNGCDGLVQFSGSQIPGLKSLDFSSCPLLEGLNIPYCRELQTINLGDKPHLTNLNCNFCNLDSLDLSACPKLSTLLCQSNKLSSLDLCGLVKLNYVDASSNKTDMIFYFNEGQKLPTLFYRDSNTQIIYKP